MMHGQKNIKLFIFLVWHGACEQ